MRKLHTVRTFESWTFNAIPSEGLWFFAFTISAIFLWFSSYLFLFTDVEWRSVLNTLYCVAVKNWRKKIRTKCRFKLGVVPTIAGKTRMNLGDVCIGDSTRKLWKEGGQNHNFCAGMKKSQQIRIICKIFKTHRMQIVDNSSGKAVLSSICAY